MKSEHAVGYLKGRFSSLKDLRQQIKNPTDHLRAVEWIRTCIVIHTLIHDIERGLEHDSDWEEELIDEGNRPLPGQQEDESGNNEPVGRTSDGRRETAGQRPRRKVREWLFASDLV